MGSSISVYTGFGVVLPWGEEDGFDFTQNPYFDSFKTSEEEQDDEEYASYSTYDIGDDLDKRYPLLQTEPTYVHDWTGETALFVRSSVQNNWGGGVFRRDSNWDSSYEETSELMKACALLGVPCTPIFLVAVSYG